MSTVNVTAEEARQTLLQSEAEGRMHESMQIVASSRRKQGLIVSSKLAAHEGGVK